MRYVFVGPAAFAVNFEYGMTDIWLHEDLKMKRLVNFYCTHVPAPLRFRNIRLYILQIVCNARCAWMADVVTRDIWTRVSSPHFGRDLKNVSKNNVRIIIKSVFTGFSLRSGFILLCLHIYIFDDLRLSIETY